VAKAWVLLAQVRHEEAIVEAEKSLALNPSAIEGYGFWYCQQLFGPT
jgi:adenylate cyclase